VQEIPHPYTTVLVWTWDTVFHCTLRETQAVQQRAEALIALCNEQGFVTHAGLATLWRDWALVMQGQAEDRIKYIQKNLAASRAAGIELLRSHALALLAEACGKTGQVEEGLTALAEALAAADKTGERWCEAELYRLKGELTLQQFKIQSSKFKVDNPQSAFRNPQSEAEACFLKAIDIVRRQQAKSLELRAVMSLARLWQSQGKKAEARQMLAGIYGWFTEGFDTKELQEAKALLQELQ